MAGRPGCGPAGVTRRVFTCRRYVWEGPCQVLTPPCPLIVCFRDRFHKTVRFLLPWKGVFFFAFDGWKTGMRAGRCDKAAVYMSPIRMGRALSGLDTALSSYRVLSGSISSDCSVFVALERGLFLCFGWREDGYAGRQV